MSVFEGLNVPKVIYETTSEYNGKIDVVQVGKVLKIRVGGFYQSVSHFSPTTERLVWGQVVEVLHNNEPELKNIMVLGLGGGTMQHLITQKFPGIYIVSVEIDPVMVDIAKKYFDTDSIPNHKIIINDACRVVVEPDSFGLLEKSFQALVVDIYIGDKYPDLGKSGNFLAAVKKMVVPGGLVVINRLYTEPHQDEVNNFIEFVSGYLDSVQSLVVAGYTNSDNVVIYGRA